MHQRCFTIGKTDIGFSDRQLENKSIRTLENNSVRLLEGSMALPAVAVISNRPATLMTGFAAPVVGSVRAIVSSPLATGFIGSATTTQVQIVTPRRFLRPGFLDWQKHLILSVRQQVKSVDLLAQKSKDPLLVLSQLLLPVMPRRQ